MNENPVSSERIRNLQIIREMLQKKWKFKILISKSHKISMGHVILDHPFSVELGSVESDRVLHHLYPARPVRIELRDNHLLKLLMEITRLITLDRPTSHVVDTTLYPPTIKGGELRDTIMRSLHTRSARGLHRRLRSIYPEIDTRNHLLGDINVIIRDISDVDSACKLLLDIEQLPDKVLARLVLRMRLAGDDELDLTYTLMDGPQPIKVREHHGQTLVRGSTTGKTQSEDIRRKVHAAGPVSEIDKLPLGIHVRIPELIVRDDLGEPERGRILHPIRDVLIKDPGHMGRSPGPGMDTIGYRRDRILREHLLGDLSMLLSDTIHIATVAKGDIGHVQLTIMKHMVNKLILDSMRAHVLGKPGIKTVMASLDRRMGSEDYLAMDRLEIITLFNGPRFR